MITLGHWTRQRTSLESDKDVVGSVATPGAGGAVGVGVPVQVSGRPRGPAAELTPLLAVANPRTGTMIYNSQGRAASHEATMTPANRNKDKRSGLRSIPDNRCGVYTERPSGGGRKSSLLRRHRPS